MPATAIAIIATAEAEAAKTLACKGYVRGFQNDTATVAEMHQYAGCITRLYPAESMSADAAIGLKVAIVLMILSMPFGAWKGARDFGFGGWDWGGFVVGVLVAPCVVAAAIAVGGLLIMGIKFVAGA